MTGDLYPPAATPGVSPRRIDMKNSAIEWTEDTFNPWWGCTKVSPACKNCYANGSARRFGHDVWGPTAPRRKLSDIHWRQPLKWDRTAARTGRRRRVFCASMADVFEQNTQVQEERARLWGLIEKTKNLDWLLLTKRPENVESMVPWHDRYPNNVWIGTSVEDQQRANVRLPTLTRIPAVVRFVSAEPLLESVNFEPWIKELQWMIVGGESGHGARRTDVRWVRQVRDLCIDHRVPFHLKQWGMFKPGSLVRVRSKKMAGRELDGRTWDERPSPDLRSWGQAL